MATPNNFIESGRKTLQDNVYGFLKRALISGEFLPGQTVTIRQITELVGSSAMPVRDALRRLVAERALEILPNGTARVCDLNNDQHLELLEMRVALEGMAVRRAAARITPSEIEHLVRLNRELRKALNGRDAGTAALRNQEFHFYLYRISNCTTLLSVIESLWLQGGPYLTRYMKDYLERRDRRQERDTLAFHDDLLEALRAGDGEAAAAAIAGDMTEAVEFLRTINEARALA